jgi:nitrogen fixation protein FixH
MLFVHGQNACRYDQLAFEKLYERGVDSMKRFSLAAVAVITTLVLAVGTSWGYESQKTTGGLTITLSVGSYPLVSGNNDVRVKITDETGKAVTDAKVSVRFYMPAMPGMAPMSSRPKLVHAGDDYKFKADVAMEGTWKAEIKVKRKGKSTATAVFNLDSR